MIIQFYYKIHEIVTKSIKKVIDKNIPIWYTLSTVKKPETISG